MAREDVELVFSQLGKKDGGSDIMTMNFLEFIDIFQGGTSDLDASKESSSFSPLSSPVSSPKRLRNSSSSINSPAAGKNARK